MIGVANQTDSGHTLEVFDGSVKSLLLKNLSNASAQMQAELQAAEAFNWKAILR